MLPPPPGWGPPPPQPSPEDDIATGVFRAHWMIVPLRVLAVTLVFVALVGPILVMFGFLWIIFMDWILYSGMTHWKPWAR